jgi:acyl-CoA synthetase (AMP-forming)/AMP-acid ligase II
LHFCLFVQNTSFSYPSGLNEANWTNQKFCLVSGTGLAHVVMTWACWMSGNTAVPLPPAATPERLAFLIKDSGATVVLATKELVSISLFHRGQWRHRRSRP